MEEYYIKQRRKAEEYYKKIKQVHCPFFGRDIIFNSDGFHHLRYSARRERTKQEQILKFTLLPLAVEILKKSGTHQEYRRAHIPLGKRGRDGFRPLKTVEYWGFIAIVGDNKIKVRVVVRKIGDGQHAFWSVMPAMKLDGDDYDRLQRLAKEGIEND